MTLGQLNSPKGSQAINTRGLSHENIHRKSNKPPSKSISQLDRARKMKQDQQMQYYNSTSGGNLNVSSGKAIFLSQTQQ